MAGSAKVVGPAKDKLLKLSGIELGVPSITKLFGWTSKVENGKFVRIPPEYDTMDNVHLEPGEYINIEAVDTTVGSILWNKLFVEGKVENAIPNHFFNKEVTKKAFGEFMGYLEAGLRQGIINVPNNLLPFLRNYEFYSMKLVTLFSPSYTQALFQTKPSVKKKREEVLKKVDKTNLGSMVDAEDELLAFARKELGNDEGMTLFNSGARGSFENDYKNMNLMVGAVKNESDGSYDFIEHGYLDGLRKEDIIAAGNIVVNSQFPKSCGTAESGYITKQYYAAYQCIVTDHDLEDCGTKRCLEFVLTADEVDDYTYQYINDNGKLVLLTEDNADKYIGKKIKLRSPMFCASQKICRHCIGEIPKMLNIESIGLTTGRIANTILAKKMKLFHNAKVKFDDIDINDLLV